MFDVCYLLTICLKGKESAVGGERGEGIKVSILENKGLFSCCPRTRRQHWCPSAVCSVTAEDCPLPAASVLADREGKLSVLRCAVLAVSHSLGSQVREVTTSPGEAPPT